MAPIRNQRARRTAGPPSSISSLSSTNSIHDSPPAISPTSSVLSGDNLDHPDAAIMGHIRNLLHDNNAWSQVVTRILMAESPEWRRLRQDVSIVNQLFVTILTLNSRSHTSLQQARCSHPSPLLFSFSPLHPNSQPLHSSPLLVFIRTVRETQASRQSRIRAESGCGLCLEYTLI